MDFTDIKQKYRLAFDQYIDFAVMYSCKSSGVSIGSSDLMNIFFDNHNLFPCFNYNSVKKQFSYQILNDKKNIIGVWFKRRIDNRSAMYTRCFHILNERLEKKT